MIIGNGLLANEFKKKQEDYKDYIIFASGVSNSDETNPDNFKREKDLVIKTIQENKSLKFIYFSSILVDTINNEYYKHKLDIETIVKYESKHYIIFRIPQVIGDRGNKHNLINFFGDLIKNNKEIPCYSHTYRSVLDINDLVNIVTYCIDSNNETLFISGIEKLPVWYIANMIGESLGKEVNIKIIDSSFDNNWKIENSTIVKKSIETFKINDNNYTKKIIKKYIK